jgi:Lrp/AsnC family leucine-responsive transcriptional regulator
MVLKERLKLTGLDETDLNILNLLSQDAKLSYADLGGRVHLTAPAVHGRVKKLEKMGIIKGYSIEIDYDLIGLPVVAFIRIQTGKLRCRDAGVKISEFKEIEECYSVAGEDDMILKTRTATPLDLQNLLDRLKTKGIVEKSISILVLENHFQRPSI